MHSAGDCTHASGYPDRSCPSPANQAYSLLDSASKNAHTCEHTHRLLALHTHPQLWSRQGLRDSWSSRTMQQLSYRLQHRPRLPAEGAPGGPLQPHPCSPHRRACRSQESEQRGALRWRITSSEAGLMACVLGSASLLVGLLLGCWAHSKCRGQYRA